ncbi:MAG: energy transducer TonB [Cyclobacteriaceae bacterium]
MGGIRDSGFMPGFGRHSSKNPRKNDPVHNESMLTKDIYQDLIDSKNERRSWDLTHKPLFKSIGLCISLSVTIIAFNWKSVDHDRLMHLGVLEEDVNELIDIPVSEQPPPPPPKVTEAFTIKEVIDEEIIEEIEFDLDIETNEETVIQEVVLTVEIDEEESETVFTIVEKEPEPVGGVKAFNEYLTKSLKYPKMASRMGISGRVFAEFVVEKDGSLTDIKIVKGIGAGCDEEAMRVLKEAPKWSPGKQRGIPVRVKRIVPITFVLKN